jgi:hypothetical protein
MKISVYDAPNMLLKASRPRPFQCQAGLKTFKKLQLLMAVKSQYGFYDDV